MQSLKIKNELYLNSEKITRQQTPIKIRKKKNYIFVFDRSGSMYDTLPKLIEDVINQLSGFSEEDYFTAGYFSSAGGDYKWILKGASLRDKEAIATTLRKYKQATNMTCFAEILSDVENVVKDVTPLAEDNSFFFMSDGNDNQKESEVKNALKKLGEKLGMSTVVGYGDWYNKQRMADIAQSLGGVLVHSSNLREFSQHFQNFRESAEVSEPKIEIKGNFSNRHLMLAITDKNDIISLEIGDKVFAPTNTDRLVYLSNSPDYKEVKAQKILPDIYAISRALLQNGNYNDALEVLGTVGDVNFIDGVTNSFTVSEYGEIENNLLNAVYDEGKRFIKGQKSGYLPAKNAFCLLDLIDILTNDETVQFLPSHPEFKYRKIGRSSKQKEGYPIFERKESAVNLNGLVWNQENLNIGVSVKIPGDIELDSEAEKFGLSNPFNTFVWRTYNIVFDGKRNIDRLPIVNPSESTLSTLRKNNLIATEDGNVFVLDLTKVPVINRAIAEGYKDLDKVCNSLVEQLELEVQNKVYGTLYKQFPAELRDKVEDLTTGTKFSDDQVKYLEKFGIKRDGAFGPPSEASVATDFLPIKEVFFDIDKMKSIPAIEKTLESIEKAKKAGKNLTPMQNLIFNANNNYHANFDNDSTEAQKALFLKETQNTNRRKLKNIRSEVGRAKFACILGKTNFTQIPKLAEENPYEYNGCSFILTVKDGKVDI